MLYPDRQSTYNLNHYCKAEVAENLRRREQERFRQEQQKIKLL